MDQDSSRSQVTAPEWVTEEEVDEDRKQSELRIFEQEAADKPENVRAKIAEGKLRKWYETVVLLNQPHVNGDCMQFEIFRNGEWLTREAAGYYGSTRQEVADYHNSLTLQNDDPLLALPAGLPIYTIWQNGGQFSENGNTGDPTVALSIDPARLARELGVVKLFDAVVPHVVIVGEANEGGSQAA